MPAYLLLQQRQLPLSVCIQLRALELSWWALIIVLRRWLASQSLILRQSGVPLVALVLVLWRLVSQALVIRQSGVLAGAFILMDESSIFCSPASALLSWLVDPPQALILLGCSTAPHRLEHQ